MAQTNISPQKAAEKWTAVKALADEPGLKLGAPAVNYSPDTWQPLPWMEEFVRLMGEDAFDYLAVHGYGDPGVSSSSSGSNYGLLKWRHLFQSDGRKIRKSGFLRIESSKQLKSGSTHPSVFLDCYYEILPIILGVGSKIIRMHKVRGFKSGRTNQRTRRY